MVDNTCPVLLRSLSALLLLLWSMCALTNMTPVFVSCRNTLLVFRELTQNHLPNCEMMKGIGKCYNIHIISLLQGMLSFL